MDHFGNLGGPIEYQYQAGFVPPSVSPPSYTSDCSEQAEKNNIDEKKKLERREKNKLAAARCRQRRMDYTNQLTKETDSLAKGNEDLKRQLRLLEQQREELQTALQIHQSQCHR